MPANRLLLIDDDSEVAETVQRAAQRAGYAVKTTSDPAAFLDQLTHWQPSVVMLDLQMPVVDGVELLRSLGSRRAKAKVIIASGVEGRVIDAARRLGKDLGVDIAGTLLKPYRMSELRAILADLAVDDEWRSPQAIEAAIERGELFLAYQPKIDLIDGHAVGYEALVRWRHPSRGIVTPDKFVPLAESAGLAGKLTDAVVEAALRDVPIWSGQNGNSLALNLSASEFADLALADKLEARFKQHGVDPHRLVLEVTETGAMAHGARAMDILTRMRLKGFRVSIDDFGTGYSSLLQLARLPFSELKIDKAFVMEAPTSPEAKVIVKSTVELAHNLGLRAVAEGVETEDCHRLVRELGCDVAQGYHIGRPMQAEKIGEWLQGWTATLDRAIRSDQATAPQRELLQSPWSKSYDGSEEMRTLLTDALANRINPLWRLGRNSLIGWRPIDNGIEVLMMPYQNIVEHYSESQRLLHGRRLMGDRTFRRAIEISGTQATPITLPFRIADDDARAVPTDIVEDVLRRYGITETQHRAVALFDIVGFSRGEPRNQVALLNSLECSINTAHEVMRSLGKAIDLARTTTGDGFYIWNRRKGAEADLETYLLTLLVVADNAIARKAGRPEMVPQIRTGFSVGPHYSYFQVDGLDPRGHDYIVGDVTIGLARIVAKCLPGQILIGDFSRPTDAQAELTNPLEFVVKADGALAKYHDVRLHGRTVAGIRCYLTGDRRQTGGFDVTRYKIRDKHGFDHHVFNQKFNIYLSDGAAAVDTLFLGKQSEDLGEFAAATATLLADEPDRRGGMAA